MRPFLFRSFAAFISIALLALTAGSVFAQPQYRVEYGYFPPDTEGIEFEDMAEVSNGEGPVELVAVGAFRHSTWSRDGFIYNHSTGQLLEMNTLLNPNDGWTSTKFFGINSNGIVVGSVSNNITRIRFGVWFDIFANTPELHFLEDSFPELQGLNHIAKSINNSGDMLIIPIKPNDVGASMSSPQYLVNPFTAESISVGDFYAKAVNDNRVIVGGDGTGAVRYDANTGDQEVFPQYGIDDINNQDQFCGSTQVQIRRNKWKRYAFLHLGADPNGSPEWTSDPLEVRNTETSLNNQGDVVGGTYFNRHMTFFYHSGLDQIFQLDELVSDSFLNTGNQFQQRVTDHDFSLATPSPIIAGYVEGSNGEPRLFFLVPDVPGPGISVSPTSGLVTTESGGTATFDVVLDTPPSADVTIDISSDDTSEGTVDKSSLTFTPANWETAQTVTVTGVDDDPVNETGDDQYNIVIAAATSDDPDYDGLDPDDVAVTNLDNDGLPGGSETYSSTDTPTDIPDKDPNGVSSNILAGNHLITGLTVNLDISHQRPSDLEVYLYGPDTNDPPIQLFNFSGDNNVAEFNGTSSLGLWTLEVIDTRKRKKGTLDGWSITVDY